MNKRDLDGIGAELLAARSQATTLAPVSARLPGFDLDAAYAVAALQRDALVAAGEHLAGRKIGFTNRNIWAQYGVDTPIWAHMYDSTVQFASGGKAQLALANLVAPRIEPEIIFRLARAPKAGMSRHELLACVEWVAHGYEMVHCHFPGWKFSAADAVADFTLHGALVVGAPLAIASIADHNAFIAQLAEFSVDLKRGGEVQDRGSGANVLGSPLDALGHLVEVLSGQPAFAPLGPGELVTTGTLTAALPVTAGETWSTALSGIALPGLEIRFI